MNFQYDKEINVVLPVRLHGITLFEVECIACVEYDSVDGEIDFKITGFKFDDGGSQLTVTANDEFQFGQLLGAVDESKILADLSENFSFSQDDDSGLYHSARHI
jgi:hypothetical protein